MEIVGRRLSLHEFQDYIKDFDFGPKLPNKIVLHHTWRPTKDTWDGERSIKGLKAYYERKEWPAGPHLFVADDGIWLFSTMRKDGIHAGKLNIFSIGIEIVGDYDEKQWEGQTKYNAFGVMKVLMDKLNLQKNQIFFHRDVSAKACPGNAITKEWLLAELDNYRILPRIPVRPSEPEKTPAIKNIEAISAPIPSPSISKPDEDLMIPVWSAEAVAWVHKNKLFEIHNHEDVRDAVKFYRFYNLIQNS